MPTMQDNQKLVAATYHSGYDIKTYDDGYGQLWISRNSIGINGIVRAKTWEDAYGICEDEFFPEATETIEEFRKEYGFKREHVKMVNDGSTIRPATSEDYEVPGFRAGIKFERWDTIDTPAPDDWSENELFQEAFGFRPDGPNNQDTLNHGIYAKDLNGDSLDLLTDEMIADLNITLTITTDEETA